MKLILIDSEDLFVNQTTIVLMRLACKIARLSWLNSTIFKESIDFLIGDKCTINPIIRMTYFQELICEMLNEEPCTLAYVKTLNMFKRDCIPIIFNWTSLMFRHYLSEIRGDTISVDSIISVIETMISCLSFESNITSLITDKNTFTMSKIQYDELNSLNGRLEWCDPQFIDDNAHLYEYYREQEKESNCTKVLSLFRCIMQTGKVDDYEKFKTNELAVHNRTTILNKICEIVQAIMRDPFSLKNEHLFHEVCTFYELRGNLIEANQICNSDDWDQHTYEFVKYLMMMMKLNLHP